MAEEATPGWTSEQWEQYAEQVRDSMPTPDISSSPLRCPDLLPTYYACPFCLRDSAALWIEKPKGGDDFTATWQVCGHRVLVVDRPSRADAEEFPEGEYRLSTRPGVVSGGA
ncbi:hypothetical protein [Streptomyces galilaeus]|uniref:hypothetical protein n=1 Tax=Streptomyces galilaeus TaxID=33899 RepID=UPI0038F69874